MISIKELSLNKSVANKNPIEMQSGFACGLACENGMVCGAGCGTDVGGVCGWGCNKEIEVSE